MQGLGHLYNKGLGVPQDYVLAYMWFNLAVSLINEDAGKLRYWLEVQVKMTPAQIAEAQRLAREWKPKGQ